MSLDQPPNSKLKNLRLRAEMLKKSRAFFEERNVLEIDAPHLTLAPNIDDHIDPIEVGYQSHKKGFLHTSPELFLKKVLALGSEDLYFLGHVFRDHEEGVHHHIEFTMVEWYRKELHFKEMIEETLDFIQLFTGPQPKQFLSYQEAFFQETKINILKASKEDLLSCIYHQIDSSFQYQQDSFSDLLIFIFANLVEPRFKKEELTIITNFPKEQAALAKIEKSGENEVAQRFEIYHQGLELANGYDEFKGELELRKRMLSLNEKRVSRGQLALPIDEAFIEANAKLPDCRGVAVGFDRLMMVKAQASTIHEILPLL